MKNSTAKIAKTILGVLLMGFGWFLEVYYYQFRFSGDGVHPVVSIVIGIGLTLLLTALFVSPSVLKTFIIIPLLLFSIYCTTSGQNFSYSLKNKSNSLENADEENNQELYNYYKGKITALEKDLQHENSLLPDDLKTRTFLNGNGVQPLLQNINNIKAQIVSYEEKMDYYNGLLNSSKTTEVISKSAYETLAEDLGLNSPTPLKLISLAALAFFISLMAPIGVRILVATYRVEPVKTKKQPEANNKNKEEIVIKKYALSRFRGEQNPSTLKGRGGFTEETGLSQATFNKLSDRAKQLNLIKVSGNITTSNVPLDQFIQMMIAKQPFKQGSFKVVNANN